MNALAKLTRSIAVAALAVGAITLSTGSAHGLSCLAPQDPIEVLDDPNNFKDNYSFIGTVTEVSPRASTVDPDSSVSSEGEEGEPVIPPSYLFDVVFEVNTVFGAGPRDQTQIYPETPNYLMDGMPKTDESTFVVGEQYFMTLNIAGGQTQLVSAVCGLPTVEDDEIMGLRTIAEEAGIPVIEPVKETARSEPDPESPFDSELTTPTTANTEDASSDSASLPLAIGAGAVLVAIAIVALRSNRPPA